MSEAAAALIGVDEAPTGDNGSANAGAANDGQSAGQPTPWTEGFDEDTSAYVKNKGWDSPDSMLESYRNLEKFSGGSKSLIEVPGDDADDESMGRFYNRLGRPESADDYRMELPEGGDSELFGWFRDTAHKNGLSDAQANSMFTAWNEMSGGRVEGMENQLKAQAETDLADLQTEWGSSFEANIDAGKRAVGALGYDEQSLSALEEKMGTGEMMKLFSNIGSKMGEDAFVDGESSDGGFGQSSAGARAELSDLKLDKGFMDRYLSGDKDAVGKMKRLMEKAYG